MLCFRCGSYNPENAQKCSVCGQGFIDEAGKVVGPPRRVSQTAQPASIFVPGEMVASRYKIGELLGQGGVGAVYRARDMEIDVDVALKAITSNLLQTEEEQKNFSKQIKGARKLQHPNIVRIYDEGHEGNRRFFTMKLLEGLTLRKIIRLRHEKGQPFSAEELVPIFHQLAAALEYAHKTTWHGDLKPENVIILPDLLKVTDFNLVKALPLKPFLGIAKSRSKGFPYIAPELRVEATTIDGRVDIYALGVILAEMLTGLVFEGHYSRAMTAALEQLPTKLDGLVRKAVAEHPDGRFLRATDLARDLETALGAMTGPLPPPAKPQPPPTLGAGATGIPQAKPPDSSGAPPHPSMPSVRKAEDVVARAPGQPPPPPEETGPSHSPVPVPSSLSLDPADPSGPVLHSEILEIGQSQVLLLASGAFTLEDGVLPSAQMPTTAPPGALADAARRLMAVGSNPDDTIDEPSGGDDVATAPRGPPLPKEIVVEPRRRSTGDALDDKLDDKLEQALAGGALAARVWDNDSRDDGLIPPPIPDLENSMDMPVQLPGDEEDEDTGEREIIAPRGVDDPLPEGALGDSTNASPASAASEIHDALTALKPHPPELMDPQVRTESAADRSAAASADRSAAASADRSAAASAKPMRSGDLAAERTDKLSRERNKLPPRIEDDDDSLKDTLSAQELQSAKERSSPRLHRAEALPPPVIAPPVLRPVAPPRRGGSGSSTIALGAILGIFLLATFVVVWRFVLSDGDKPTDVNGDHAIVTPGDPDEAPAIATLADAGTGIDDATKEPVVVARLPDGPKTTTSPTTTTPTTTTPTGTGTPTTGTSPTGTPTTGTSPTGTSPTSTTPSSTTPTSTTPTSTTPTSTTPNSTTPTTTPPDGPVIAMASGSCPKGMALVEGGAFTFGSTASDPMRNFGEADAASADVKPYCVDYYEQPNGKDSLPTTGVSWQAAKNACERLGRRLCSEREWERACKGPSSNRFPYGNTYDAEVCNTEDGEGKARALAPATSFKRCRSGYKAFMMAGNAEEWVLDSVNGQKIAKGGAADRPDFASRCSSRRALAARTTAATLGFRCCADPR